MEGFKNTVSVTICGEQDVRAQEGFKGETVELLTFACDLSMETSSALLENRWGRYNANMQNSSRELGDQQTEIWLCIVQPCQKSNID